MAEQIQRTTNVTRTPDYREFYANSVNLRVSNWDFFFEFGKISTITDKEIDVSAEAGVYLSPQQTKALLAILTEHLSRYERNFGEIAVQPK